LIDKDPAQLVVEALQAYPNNATTAIDLEITLAQALGEDRFKKWWATAKKSDREGPAYCRTGQEDRVLRIARNPGFRRG
jgi:hypothetical protein